MPRLRKPVSPGASSPGRPQPVNTFTAASFPIVRREELPAIANLQAGLAALYQPVNSRETFAQQPPTGRRATNSPNEPISEPQAKERKPVTPPETNPMGPASGCAQRSGSGPAPRAVHPSEDPPRRNPAPRVPTLAASLPGHGHASQRLNKAPRPPRPPFRRRPVLPICYLEEVVSSVCPFI
jgi:hypothetical protein